MVPGKRKYEKKQKDYKVSIKHYLNKNLKPKMDRNSASGSGNSSLAYPLYVQITVRGQVLRLRSNCQYYFSEDEFKQFVDTKPQELEAEKNRLTEVVNILKPWENKNFTIFYLGRFYHKYNEPLPAVIKYAQKVALLSLLVEQGFETLIKMVDWSEEIDWIRMKISYLNSDLKELSRHYRVNYELDGNFFKLLNEFIIAKNNSVVPAYRDWKDTDLRQRLISYCIEQVGNDVYFNYYGDTLSALDKLFSRMEYSNTVHPIATYVDIIDKSA